MVTLTLVGVMNSKYGRRCVTHHLGSVMHEHAPALFFKKKRGGESENSTSWLQENISGLIERHVTDCLIIISKIIHSPQASR